MRWIGERAAEAAARAARLGATGSGGVTCHKPGESGARPGSLGVAGRGALVSTGVAGRGAEVSDPARDTGLFGTKAVATTPVKAEVASAKTATAVTAPVVTAPAKITAAPVKVAAEKPAAEKPVAEKPAASDKSHDVLLTVNAWAAAWSSQNVKKYLSYYAADFHTPDHETRTNWEASRKDRISKPKSIEVVVSNGVVDFTDDNHATVKFHQKYRSSSIKAAGPKTLLMVKSGSSWFILEERSN